MHVILPRGWLTLASALENLHYWYPPFLSVVVLLDNMIYDYNNWNSLTFIIDIKVENFEYPLI